MESGPGGAWVVVATAAGEMSAEAFVAESLRTFTAKPYVVNKFVADCRVLVQREGLTAAEATTSLATYKVPHPELHLDSGPDARYNVMCRGLFSKDPEHCADREELVVVDEHRLQATYLPADTSDYAQVAPIRFRYHPGGGAGPAGQGDVREDDPHDAIQLLAVRGTEGAGYVRWAAKHVLPKLVKWASPEQAVSQWDAFRGNLVTRAEFSTKYRQLKQRHGTRLVKNWTESTDPQKFVFEDVAICAYLICLFEKERAAEGGDGKDGKKQSFVDLGCGNGLLVYLLNQEGYPGIGLDVRKRKIWDFFEGTTLLESPVNPIKGLGPHVPQCDWVIGNHSDELTPWVPVLTANHSFNCKFFLLPCCFFNFVDKFSDNDARIGQYRTYLRFVKSVSERCGFVVEHDVLQIPSTKRICLVGRHRVYGREEGAVFAARRAELVGDAPARFVAKASKEPIRNCLTVDRSVREAIVSEVARLLLDATPRDPEGAWHLGGRLPISEVAKHLGKAQLKKLKTECGGLQTLFRNYRQVFSVYRGGVGIRDWRTPKEASVSGARKTKCCWFFDQHPDGCPVAAEQCSFAHGSEDLRERPAAP